MESHQHGEGTHGSPTGVKERHRMHGDAKHARVSARQDLEKQKGRPPLGEEKTRSVCVLSFENGLFCFEANRSSKQSKVSQ